MAVYSLSSSNSAAANHDKKVSIACAYYTPCLNGICIGEGCSSASSQQYNTDTSDNTKQPFNVEQLSNSNEQIRSNVNSLGNNHNQKTNNANDCIESPTSMTFTNRGERDQEDFKSVIDSGPNAKWSSNDGRVFIQMDLGEIKRICSFNIHWYNGEKSAYTFMISSSIDGVNFTDILRGKSDGSSASSENYPIIKEVQGRYIRLDAYRDSKVSGVSDVTVYANQIINTNGYSTPQNYLVKSDSPLSAHEPIKQIEPNQYVDLISQIIKANLLQMKPDRNIETAPASAIQINLPGNGTDGQ